MSDQRPEKMMVETDAWLTAVKWVCGDEKECILELEENFAVLKQLNSRHTEYVQAKIRSFQGSFTNRRTTMAKVNPSFNKTLEEEAFLILEILDSKVILKGKRSQTILPVSEASTQLPNISVNLENRVVVKTKQLAAAMKSLSAFKQNLIMEASETNFAFKTGGDSETSLKVKPLLIRIKEPCRTAFNIHDLNHLINRLPKSEGFVELFFSQNKPLEIRLNHGSTLLSAYLAPLSAEE
jgi:hypothetical protein